MIIVQSRLGNRFKLTPTVMKENSTIPYIMRRSTVAKLFRNPNLTLDVRYYYGSFTWWRTATACYLTEGIIRVGCQNFNEAETAKLKKWANKKRKK